MGIIEILNSPMPKDETAEEKRRLLSNPDAIEKAVANMADFYSPTASTKKPKGESYGLDSVEKSKDSDDPTVGFGNRLRDDFTKALLDPNLAGRPAGELLHRIAEGRMMEVQPGGKSLLEKAFEFKKTEDSRLWGVVRSKELPGYADWLKDKKLQEQQVADKESWFPSKEDLATGVGLGALTGATAGALGSGIAGISAGAGVGAAAGLMLAGPPGAAVGTVLGAVTGALGGAKVGAGVGAVTGGIIGLGGELLAAPAKKLLHKTDWYQGMVQSNSIVDNAKVLAAEMIPYAVGGVAAQRGLMKAGETAVAKRMIGDVGQADLPGMIGEVPGKAPAGPGIDLSGERINPKGSWAEGGATVTEVPRAPGEFSPAGLLGDEGVNKLPPPQFPRGPEGPSSGVGPNIEPGPLGYDSEIPKLLGSGKGYDWSGVSDIGKGEKKNLFGIPETSAVEGSRSQLLLEDLRGNDLEDFTKFAAEARGKVYSDLMTPEVNPLVMSEDELFKVWQQRADKGIRPFNPYEKMRADSTALDGILARTEGIAKARADIAELPKANTVLEATKKTPKAPEPVVGSDLIEKHEMLSAKGLQETGLEPVVDSDVVPLTGTLPDRIRQAADRDTFVELGKESSTGKLRTQLVANAEAEAKTKLSPVKIDDPIVEGMTKVDPEVVVTPKQQASAIEKVVVHTEGAKTVEEKFFGKPKAEVDGDGLSGVLGIEDSLDANLAKARVPLELDNPGGKLERARSMYMELLGDEGKPLTSKELLADLTEQAGGDPKKLKTLIRQQEGQFLLWAEERGLIKSRKDFSKEERSKYKLIAGMMAFGLPAGVIYDSISEDSKADASVLSSLKGFVVASSKTKAAKDALVRESAKLGLTAKGITKETVMGAENFQKGIMSDPKEIQAIVNANLRKGPGTGAQYALMSPYQILESLFTTGKGKMVNAASHLASFVTAGSRTRNNAIRVVTNVLEEGGIKIAANEVKTATTPLVPLAARAAKADVAAAQIKDAEKRIAKITKKIKPNSSQEDIDAFNSTIKVEQEGIAKLRGTLEELSGATKQYHDAWTETMKGLAGKHSSVRVSLALEDPTRQLYPWLPQLTRSEEVAVGKLRGLLDQYKVRLTERGKPIRDNYFPHSPHPEMAKIFNAEMGDILGGAPYQKFYSRTDSSRALLPDINYTMNHYLTDVEQRIQNYDFWKKSGWEKIKNSSAVQANPGLKRAFDLLYDGSKPVEHTWGNVAAQRYSEFEAVHKLFLSPSAGLKHLVKMTADIVSVGPTVWAKSLPETVGWGTRKLLNHEFGLTNSSIRDRLAKIGVKSERFSRQLIDDYMDSAIMSGNMRKYMMDMGIDNQEQVFSTAKRLWQKTQDVGSVWINMAELVDRATSVSSALQMAGKRGMTADQAMYGTYDLILKNNFLFGQFNPSWLNNPKIRALFMFQATPFKIFERRFVNAQKSLANVKQLSTEMQKIVKQDGGWGKVYADMKSMKSYLREGQSELKSNLFIDTLRNEADFFGTPIIRQSAMDMLTVAAATYGGAQVGLSLGDHFFHIPFLSTMSEEGKAELALSPLAKNTMTGYNAWKNREEGEDFLLGSIVRRWLGPYGPLPKTLEKAVKLHSGDIPEIYNTGGEAGYLKYFFSIPGKEN